MKREEYDYKMSRFIGTLTKTSLEEMFKVINSYQSSLEQRIVELEKESHYKDMYIGTLQTPKTCEGCRFNDGIGYKAVCQTCCEEVVIRKNYEPKD